MSQDIAGSKNVKVSVSAQGYAFETLDAPIGRGFVTVGVHQARATGKTVPPSNCGS